MKEKSEQAENGMNRWAERIYEETDLGKSLGTNIAGVAGLIAYETTADWVIAAFVLIIVFTVSRVIASSIERSVRSDVRVRNREVTKRFDNLSNDEMEGIDVFISHGGCVLTSSQTYNSVVTMNAIESLRRRGLLWEPTTLDAMQETFEISPELFDLAQRNRAQK